MTTDYRPDDRVYATERSGLVSIADLLAYFEERGAMRVSDLHLKVGAAPTYRVDGRLVPLKGEPLTTDAARRLVYPLLDAAARQRLAQDLTVDCSYRLGTLQYRINVFQENDGLAAAIRALALDVPPVEDIGFPNDVWEDVVERKHGLVLLTGITGAGKSTTIASLLGRISERRACRIISLEDPIEYLLPANQALISQREVGRDVRSFHAGLRDMMREDPDILFVGEMRDPETIAMTLMAAETGHLVFSTLHTRDVTGTVTRILDYFEGARQVEVRNQLSLSLAYILCQKLLPKKDGSGRLVAMEILNNNYAVANLIRTGKAEQLYSQLQIRTRNVPEEKMITLERHLALLVKRGQVEMIEARKWANNPKSFDDALQQVDHEATWD